MNLERIFEGIYRDHSRSSNSDTLPHENARVFASAADQILIVVCKFHVSYNCRMAIFACNLQFFWCLENAKRGQINVRNVLVTHVFFAQGMGTGAPCPSRRHRRLCFDSEPHTRNSCSRSAIVVAIHRPLDGRRDCEEV